MRTFIRHCTVNLLSCLAGEVKLTRAEVTKSVTAANILNQQYDKVGTALAGFSLPLANLWLEYVAIPRVVKRILYGKNKWVSSKKNSISKNTLFYITEKGEVTLGFQSKLIAYAKAGRST